MRLLLLLGPTLDWYFADALDRLAELPTVIARRTVPIRPDDTWHRLELRAYESGLDMLAEACSAIARDV